LARYLSLFHNASYVVEIVLRGTQHVSCFQLVGVDVALNLHVLTHDELDELIDLCLRCGLMLVVSYLHGHRYKFIAGFNRFRIDDVSFVGSIRFDRLDEFFNFKKSLEILGEVFGAGCVDFR
jgi:hypothetical protein